PPIGGCLLPLAVTGQDGCMGSHRTNSPTRLQRWLLALGAAGACVVLSPPSSAQEEGDDATATRGLLLDLERILDSQEGSGWFLDQHEIDEAYPTLLESVCRAPQSVRREALRQIERRAKRAGDP